MTDSTFDPRTVLSLLLEKLEASAISLFAGLIAILVLPDDEEPLLVYLPYSKRGSFPINLRTIDLEELVNSEPSKQRGTLIVIPDVALLTIPPGYKVRISQLLEKSIREMGGFPELRYTWSKLGEKLYESITLPGWKPRIDLDKGHYLARVITLVTPRILEEETLEDLLAVFPAQDTRDFVESGISQLIYRHTPRGKRGKREIHNLNEVDLFAEATGSLIVAFGELLEERSVESHPFIELRHVLLGSGLNTELRRTLYRLSLDLLRKWKRGEHNDQDLIKAFAVATEANLIGEDLNDLVAVIPSSRYCSFLRHHDTLFVYRELAQKDEGLMPNGGYRVAYEKLRDFPRLEDYGEFAFGLTPAHKYLTELKIKHVASLEPILLNLGKANILVENLWLMGRDLLNLLPPDWPAQVYPSLIHSLVILADSTYQLGALDDESFEKIYLTLDAFFEKRLRTCAKEDSPYLEALEDWYGLRKIPPEEVRSELESIIHSLEKFQKNQARIYGLSGFADNQLEQTNIMRRMCNAIVALGSRGGQPEQVRELFNEFGINIRSNFWLSHRVFEDQKAVPIPSPLFLNAFSHFVDLEESIQKTRISKLPVDRMLVLLDESLRLLKQAQDLVGGMPHEKQILKALYGFSIEQCNQMIINLRGNPQVEVIPAVGEIVLNVASTLSFTIHNVGQANAEHLEIELLQAQRLQLMDLPPFKRIQRVLPAKEERTTFQVKGLSEGETSLQLQVSYDRQSPQIYRFPLKISSPRKTAWRRKENPYSAGDSVHDHRDFYGHKQAVADDLATLVQKKRQNILVGGGKRTGKTSRLNMLLLNIMDRNRNKGVRNYFKIDPSLDDKLNELECIYVDLMGTNRKGIAIDTSDFYQRILDEMQGRGMSNQMVNQVHPGDSIRYRTFLEIFCSTLKQHPHRRLVMLIDEFDLLTQDYNQELAENLRSLILDSDARQAVWVVSSSSAYLRAIGDYRSPLFNVFLIESVKRLDPEAARDLILSPWGSESNDAKVLHFADDALAAILFETGSWPFFLQLLCRELVIVANREGSDVQIDMVYRVIQDITSRGSSTPANLNYLWDNLPSFGRAILSLLNTSFQRMSRGEVVLALGQWLESAQFDVSEDMAQAESFDEAFKRAIEKLESVGVIEIDISGNESYYQLGIPLARYIFKTDRARLIVEVREQLRSIQAGLLKMKEEKDGVSARGRE